MAPAVWALNAPDGRTRVMPMPMVRTMRQPPNSVPSAMARWQEITTQNGTCISPCRNPLANSSTVMMPMVFCASLPPWPRLYMDAEMNCALLNPPSVRDGDERWNIHRMPIDSATASSMPSIGERMMADEVLISPLAMTTSGPDLASAAPTRPPTSACEDDDGMPNHQVMTFQMMAPDSAPKITALSTMAGSMMPEPTVIATCRPNTRKAMKLKNAAHTTAACGVSSRVDTISAMELAESWKPFMKSNSSATATSSAMTRNAWSISIICVRARRRAARQPHPRRDRWPPPATRTAPCRGSSGARRRFRKRAAPCRHA